ncbi:hypothetical protein ACFL01_04220, partial [Planctomycetota bacterium]
RRRKRPGRLPGRERPYDALTAGGDYDGAMALWNTIPEKFADTLAKRAKAESDQLSKTAQQKIESALKEADEALGIGEPEKALAVLSKVENFTYDALSAKVAAAKEKVKDALANVAGTRAKKALAVAGEKFVTHMQSFDKAMFEGDFAAAGKAIAAAQSDTDMAPLTAQVSAAKALVESFNEAKEAEKNALTALVGTETELRLTNGEKHKGTIKDVSDGVISLRIVMIIPGGGRGETTRKFKIADLDPGYKKSLIPGAEAPETDTGKLAGALVAMGAGDLDKATALLEKVTTHPLKEHYQKKAREMKLGAAEVAAEDAWKKLLDAGGSKEKLDRPTAKKLKEIVASFEQNHAGSEYAKGLGEKLESLKMRIAVAFEVSSYKGAWAQRTPKFIGTDGKPIAAGPSGSNCGAAYDSKRKLCVLYGSGIYSGPRNDMWTYDPAKDTWTCLNTHVQKPAGKLPDPYFPGGSTSVSFCYDPAQDLYRLFGAEGSLWNYNPTAKSWKKQPGFRRDESKHARQYSGLGYHPGLKSLVAVCGPFDPKTAKVDPGVSPPYMVHYGWQPSSAVMSNGLAMPDENGCYIAFGRDQAAKGKKAAPRTWQFDPAKGTWTELTPKQSPSARVHANVVYHNALKVWVLYGGYHYDDKETMADTWIYAPHLNTWLEVKPEAWPPASSSGTLWYDDANDQIIFYGGGRRTRETWTLKITPSY